MSSDLDYFYYKNPKFMGGELKYFDVTMTIKYNYSKYFNENIKKDPKSTF